MLFTNIFPSFILLSVMVDASGPDVRIAKTFFFTGHNTFKSQLVQQKSHPLPDATPARRRTLFSSLLFTLTFVREKLQFFTWRYSRTSKISSTPDLTSFTPPFVTETSFSRQRLCKENSKPQFFQQTLSNYRLKVDSFLVSAFNYTKTVSLFTGRYHLRGHS